MQSLPITINVVSSNPTQAMYARYNICDKVCQCPATGRCFSLSTQVSSNNKADRHEIVEILLKVVLITITITPPVNIYPRLSLKKR